jgi:hypothetical protein
MERLYLISGGGDDIRITFIPAHRNVGRLVNIAKNREEA